MSETHNLEEVTFRTSDGGTIKYLKEHYVEQQPVMVGNICYKIAQIVVNFDPYTSSEIANPYTVKMCVYPTGGAVEKTDYVKSSHKELLGKISPKFLNHKGKRLSILYKRLDETKAQIQELEEE